jgi:hypothetical protein
MMTNPNALYEDMDKLNALYEELCWDYDDELIFTHDGEKILVINKTQKDNGFT